jgi:hypothetical protein
MHCHELSPEEFSALAYYRSTYDLMGNFWIGAGILIGLQADQIIGKERFMTCEILYPNLPNLAGGLS